MARFVSIDNNYAGEAEDINTQNRYVYTLNNPYKYVDRDGKKAKKSKKKEIYPLEAETQFGSNKRTTIIRYTNGYQSSVTKKYNLDGTISISNSDGYYKLIDNEEDANKAFKTATKQVSQVIICKEKKKNLGEAGAEFVKGLISAFTDFPSNVINTFTNIKNKTEEYIKRVKYALSQNVSTGIMMFILSVLLPINEEVQNIVKPMNDERMVEESIFYMRVFIMADCDPDKYAQSFGFKSYADMAGKTTGNALIAFLISKGIEKIGSVIKPTKPSETKFNLKNPESFKGSSIKEVESYLDDALNGFEKKPLKSGEGVRYFDGKGNSWQLNYGYENAADAIHGSPYLKTTVNGEIIRIPLK